MKSALAGEAAAPRGCLHCGRCRAACPGSAIREDGTQIDGLFMVGNDSGGFFSVSYPNLFTGLAVGRTMTFGRRAGKLAAQGK